MFNQVPKLTSGTNQGLMVNERPVINRWQVSGATGGLARAPGSSAAGGSVNIREGARAPRVLAPAPCPPAGAIGYGARPLNRPLPATRHLMLSVGQSAVVCSIVLLFIRAYRQPGSTPFGNICSEPP